MKTNFGIILEIFLLIPLIHEDRVENFGELKKPTHEYNPKIFGIGFQKEGITIPWSRNVEGFSKEFFHRFRDPISREILHPFAHSFIFLTDSKKEKNAFQLLQFSLIKHSLHPPSARFNQRKKKKNPRGMHTCSTPIHIPRGPPSPVKTRIPLHRWMRSKMQVFDRGR